MRNVTHIWACQNKLQRDSQSHLKCGGSIQMCSEGVRLSLYVWAQEAPPHTHTLSQLPSTWTVAQLAWGSYRRLETFCLVVPSASLGSTLHLCTTGVLRFVASVAHYESDRSPHVLESALTLHSVPAQAIIYQLKDFPHTNNISWIERSTPNNINNHF